jgi:hypothetical protein
MLSVLVLSDIRNAAQRRVAILDHIHCLDHATQGRVAVTYVNMAEVAAPDPCWLEFDVVVLHTTLLCWRWHPQFSQLAARVAWLEEFTGLVVAMPQDEYNHAHTLDDWLHTLGVQVVVTCFDASTRALLYPQMHARAYFVEALTGFLTPSRIPEVRRLARPTDARQTDVIYRANNSPFWIGWLGYTKSRLGTDGARILAETSLRCDISVRPADTVLGEEWLGFLSSSRVILGSESGSSVLDRRGEIGRHVRTLLADQPDLSFEATDELTGGELTRYHFGALGPRHLEAIMTGTVQVLVEGAYQGILRPWEHYIPVKRDLSDLAAIPEHIGNPTLMRDIAECALEECVLSGTYGYDRFADHLLDVIDLFRSVQHAPAPLHASA